MSLLPLFQWLQNTALATALRESALVYPVVLALHLTGMALFGGMILMTDMRLLGLAMRGSTVSDVVGQLRVWKRLGLALVVGCGVLLAWSKAEFYYHNPFFWTKLTLLLLVGIHALVFRRGVYNNTEVIDRTAVIPLQAKIAAGLSLALWVGLVSAGRLIGYYEVKL